MGLQNDRSHEHRVWQAPAMTASTWPLFDLRVVTPRLELRYVDDELASELGALAAAGVHDPAFMPFTIPWTDAQPPELQRDMYRFYWRTRAETRAGHFHLALAVVVDGRPVGGSSLGADDFGVLGEFETGSWLGRAHQGQGLGRELREATLHLGFAGLGARRAVTAAFDDNVPSLAVTRRLGYAENGERHVVRRGEPARHLLFHMDRAHWEAHVRRDDLRIEGLEGALDLLGVTPQPAPEPPPRPRSST